MLTVVLRFLSSTFDVFPGKPSLPWDFSFSVPTTFPPLLKEVWSHHSDWTELISLPSTTALNPLLCIVKLSSSLDFPAAREDALIFLEVAMMIMQSSARKLHNFSCRKNIKEIWWFIWLRPQPLLVKHKDYTHQKPKEAELNNNMCRETISHGSLGAGSDSYCLTSSTGCWEICSVPSIGAAM